MTYFIQRQLNQYGPYSLADLQTYLSQGSILMTDLARTETMATWVPLTQLLGPPAAMPPPVAAPAGAPGPAAVPLPPGYQPTAYPVVQPAYQQKSRIGFILLGVFLGGLGIHNFYAGYTNKGVAQLLISVLTLGIGAIASHIWAIVDICTVDKDSNGVPFN